MIYHHLPLTTDTLNTAYWCLPVYSFSTCHHLPTHSSQPFVSTTWQPFKKSNSNLTSSYQKDDQWWSIIYRLILHFSSSGKQRIWPQEFTFFIPAFHHRSTCRPRRFTLRTSWRRSHGATGWSYSSPKSPWSDHPTAPQPAPCMDNIRKTQGGSDCYSLRHRKLRPFLYTSWFSYPRCSMYGIFTVVSGWNVGFQFRTWSIWAEGDRFVSWLHETSEDRMIGELRLWFIPESNPSW